MKTINLSEFTKNFMIISKNLTNAEVRMLYLLISNADTQYLSQQEFADLILTHRRTINIGLKRLQEYGYISELNIKHTHVEDNEKVPKKDIKQAMEVIVESFINFYHPTNNYSIVVNEDFYSSILGNHRIHRKLKHKKDFVTNTIKKRYPRCEFHFTLKKSSYISENSYTICRYINSEIINARGKMSYHLKKDVIMNYLFDNYTISEEEVSKVIQEEFPSLTIVKNRINIPKPLK